MIIKHFFENKAIEESILKKTLTQVQIEDLKSKNILMIKKNNYNSKILYFKFVGFLTFNELVLVVLPKYILNLDNKYNDTKNLMKILERYFKSKNKFENNLWSLDFELHKDNFYVYSYYKYLLQDFLDFGIYSNHKIYSNLNGDGEIDWDKTVNSVNSYILKDKSAIYLDFYTSDILSDNETYIKNLHEYYLTKASKYLCKLNDYGFNFPKLFFSIDSSNIGSKEYRLHKINKELISTFSDRKINLLKTLKNLVEKESNQDQDDLLLYGTTSFYDVWEKACGFIFKNQYEKFKKYIPKPNWHSNYNKEIQFYKETFIPDILVETEKEFYIFDAKYYLPKIDKKSGFPGIESISKQYLYEMIFSDLEILKDKERHNIFLIPTTNDSINYFLEVELDFLKKIGLQNIKMIELPIKLVFDLYIKNKTLSLDELEY
ncbi:MAG: LlaJI family restriction endonuclease [Fusobacteriaceae bacterium]